jgi:glucose-1-phosphate cytidylyltransferase
MAETGPDALTGSRLRKAMDYSPNNTFLATYGDGVSDVDIRALISHHRQSGKLATVTAVRPSSRFGEIGINNGLVDKFREKPQVTEGWINGGFFVFEKEALNDVPDDDNVTLEEFVLEKLATERELAVYQHDGFWQSMDTYREMQLLNEMWESGTAPWTTWEECRLSA